MEQLHREEKEQREKAKREKQAAMLEEQFNESKI
jgi:hypothetical protein